MRGTVLHYSVTPPVDHAQCAAQVEGIRAYHKRTGYRDIAYGWLVCQHGGVFYGRGWGPNAANGSAQLNRDYHAVCWLGDQHTDPSEEAKAAIAALLDERADARPVLGHSDVHATSCPGPLLGFVRAGATVPKKGEARMERLVRNAHNDEWWYFPPTGGARKVDPLTVLAVASTGVPHFHADGPAIVAADGARKA